MPFSHQNEVNFLPKADTAVGKPGEVSARCSCPGPPPPRAPNGGITASRRLHPATPTVPDPVSLQKSIATPSPSLGAALTFSQFASLFRCPPRQDFGENALSFPPGLPCGRAGGTTRPGCPWTGLAVCWGTNEATVSRGRARPGELGRAPRVSGSRRGVGWHRAAGPTDLLLPGAVLRALSLAAVALSLQVWMRPSAPLSAGTGKTALSGLTLLAKHPLGVAQARKRHRNPQTLLHSPKIGSKECRAQGCPLLGPLEGMATPMAPNGSRNRRMGGIQLGPWFPSPTLPLPAPGRGQTGWSLAEPWSREAAKAAEPVLTTGAGCPPGCAWSVAGVFPAAWAGPGCCCGGRDDGGPCVLPLASGCAEPASWAACRAAGCCRAACCPACCCLAAGCCGCARGSGFGAGVANPCGWGGFCALGVSAPWW